jgi:hypothetical protein
LSPLNASIAGLLLGNEWVRCVVRVLPVGVRVGAQVGMRVGIRVPGYMPLGVRVGVGVLVGNVAWAGVLTQPQIDRSFTVFLVEAAPGVHPAKARPMPARHEQRETFRQTQRLTAARRIARTHGAGRRHELELAGLTLRVKTRKGY